MIGPILSFDVDFVSAFVLPYLFAGAVGLALGAVAGWLAARFVINSDLTLTEHEDGAEGPHSWLRHLPLTPMLALGALVLPLLTVSPVLIVVGVAVLAAPTVFTLGLRYLSVPDAEDAAQTALNRQAVLRSGWRDSALVGGMLLIGGLLAVWLVAEAHTSLTDQLPNLVPGLLFGIAGGAVLGLGLGLLRNRINAVLDERHHQGEYSLAIDGTLGAVLNVIEAVLTQFHGTPLAGVLAIAATALPYTFASQSLALPLLIFPPVASAMLAALMVDSPPPDEPGVWQHLRTGLTNVMAICIGFMIGTAMLPPMAELHSWMINEPDQFADAFTTHLDLTFTSLALSLFLGILGGVLSSRLEMLRTILINLGNVGRTIPSLAVLALALPLVGVGRAPTLVALIFIGTLPILVNTSVGIIEVSRDIKEAARGMGMSDWQVLVRVEIPVAMPVIMAGIRTSAVLVVASATLAGFIGGGGLGDLIYRGDSSGRDDILFAGAVTSTILAVFLEYLFGWLEQLLTPRGLREHL